jgi:hypothetical protein
MIGCVTAGASVDSFSSGNQTLTSIVSVANQLLGDVAEANQTPGEVGGRTNCWETFFAETP